MGNVKLTHLNLKQGFNVFNLKGEKKLVIKKDEYEDKSKKETIFDDYRFVGIDIQVENLFISGHDSDLHIEHEEEEDDERDKEVDFDCWWSGKVKKD